MPDICIIIPVLNERENIGRLIERIAAVLPVGTYVVCLVDDGSTDGTRDLLEREAKKHPQQYKLIYRSKNWHGSQRGGALLLSLRWGLRYTTCRYFVEMDGDLSHRAEELPAGLTKLQRDEADVVIASKYWPGSQVTDRPLARRMVSWLCNVAVRALLGPRIRDFSNGYRFYNRRAAEIVAGVKIRYGSPIYLSEVLAIWLRSQLRIVEIPSWYVGRNEGVSKLRILDLAKAGIAVFEIALRRHLLGFNGTGEETRSQAVLARADEKP